MTYTAIWVVAWLIGGTPVTFSALLPGDQCTFEAARAVFDAQKAETPRGVFQEPIEFWCDAVRDRPVKDGA